MTDYFSTISLASLLEIILKQYDSNKSIFGIQEEQFFNPLNHKEIHGERFGDLLETPIGVAAGPHSQMAQNIIAAWLTGARFIELKTIQTLDELEVSKPCIDMQDEGYNCEWSQELKIHQSFKQYLNAWIIIHILRDKFGWMDSIEPGLIFNMSIGYNYEGILKDNVQWFFEKMDDASDELVEKIESIKHIYPNVLNLSINPQLSNNITLSTMHGCPSDEIEKIGAYLITEKKIHTAIKLNPTLLGKEKLHEIMKASGFETQVPDIAFEHDLKYKDALGIIKNLSTKAKEQDVCFSLKLTNTLESANHKEVFPSNEEMMYMSGKALHVISMNVAYKLQKEFNNELDISFSGGADAFNIQDIINCGLSPVTVCSDLLKPGGYTRLQQYIQALEKIEKAESSFDYLEKYIEELKNNKAYKKNGFNDPSIKTDRELGYFDCAHAPCVDTCPTNQGIPDYMHYTAKGDFEKAAQVIKETNPFPLTTGMVCDHLCQTKCTRINYDSPLLIREIKRFIAEEAKKNGGGHQEKIGDKKAAIIGAGPAGLSCAYYLAIAGVEVNVYESKEQGGGMASGAIPSFRLTDEAIGFDMQKIIDAGVKVHYNHLIKKQEFQKLQKENQAIFIGAGAQVSKALNIDGIKAEGVLDPLDFLFKVKDNKPSGIAKNVIIIGGGNTAMDAARTAYRMVGKNGKVTIVYRRTIKQMPADLGEIKAVLEEGVEIVQLAAPLEIKTENGKVQSLLCCKMSLGKKDESGRASITEITGSDFEILADTIIPAIGQDLDIDFATADELKIQKGKYQTKLPQVYIGGDALRGASTAINAIGDGRKAAQEILENLGLEYVSVHQEKREAKSVKELMLKKSKRIAAQTPIETNLNDRKNFKLVSTTLTKEQAMEEASRCLLCDEVCNICTTVCPNLAFHAYAVTPQNLQLQNIKVRQGEMEKEEAYPFNISQSQQILHIADWCNQCGNCNTFCPSSGAPYQEKPHLYLTIEEFEKEKEGCYLNTEGGITELLFYKEQNKYNLRYKEGSLEFETQNYRLTLDKNIQPIEIKIKEKTNFEIDLSIAAQMSLLLQGAKDFLRK
ncbi:MULTISPECIES: putative selenate reductase subunit YgfK [unclassified Lentimicrobium]|uniref:putative selenate reductase subunit YgfK n=1 Tax=unclassified Lentimicrobium TaxID=2677434 RepID=UPI001551A009|nr:MULTISPECIES: putative selenate reductase subunit YgfK [unclassified Lentimicrobium]NPD44306.1 putative selenate reductase subunit YgfK [Lentimicrobium sp. S6]NPD84589.1 putative selenate reductase subunit YgfK [Lentimicrobium sp. L6]